MISKLGWCNLRAMCVYILYPSQRNPAILTKSLLLWIASQIPPLHLVMHARSNSLKRIGRVVLQHNGKKKDTTSHPTRVSILIAFLSSLLPHNISSSHQKMMLLIRAMLMKLRLLPVLVMLMSLKKTKPNNPNNNNNAITTQPSSQTRTSHLILSHQIISPHFVLHTTFIMRQQLRM